MSCKVGNQTNSQDPQAVNSRVFVGNLNTFQCSKTDVERMFQRYGRIAGISMHKGYAFIQFTNPFDARSACLGEDGRLIWGQTLDVNMVAEPKAHQTGRKRQNIAKTGNDWDYYYDSYYAQVGFPTPRLVPPMKRARLHVPPTAAPRSVAKPSSPNKPFPSNTSLGDLKSYSTPDILICGNCRELFSEIEQLMEHKKTYCKLRFTCKCHMLNGCAARSPAEEPASLLCSQCKDSFHSAWDLMVHVQAAHMLNIYQLSTTEGAVPNNNSNTITRENILEENGGMGVGNMLMESGSNSKSLGIGTNGNGSLMEEGSGTMMQNSTHVHLPITHHQCNNNNNNNVQRETSPSSTSTTDGHSPCGAETNSSSCFNEILMDQQHAGRGTPERPLNGNLPLPQGNFTHSRAPAFPMEASTQTQTIQTDNPSGFDDHSVKDEGLTHFA